MTVRLICFVNRPVCCNNSSPWSSKGFSHLLKGLSPSQVSRARYASSKSISLRDRTHSLISDESKSKFPPLAFRNPKCHSEHSEKSPTLTNQTLRFAQGDSFEIVFYYSSYQPWFGSVDSSHFSISSAKSSEFTRQSSFKSPGRYIVPKSPQRRGISRIFTKSGTSILPFPWRSPE